MYQEAACSILPFLSKLLPEAEAKVIDQKLSNLLAQAKTGQPIDNLILDVLAAHDTTREWLSEFLEGKQQSKHLKNLDFLPGEVSIVNADKFVCPQGDYIWYRPRVGIEPPHCSAFFAYYFWAIDAARNYGELIEATFDLYRHLLYQYLRWDLPSDPNEERRVGKQLTQ
jgi:hypothetical protein